MSDLTAVRTYLETLQDTICDALENEDGSARFDSREILRDGGGVSRPRVLSDGSAIERTAVHYSHTVGKQLPPAASERRPELTGGAYEAASVSLIVHPRNPYVPTAHANFRVFSAQPQAGGESVWGFGGGFDLTPYYGFEEDAVHWHRTARDACAKVDPDLYPRLKRACDEYFFLPHRDEARGIGGVLFDDFDEGGFENAFRLQRSIGNAYLEAYLPIVNRRKGLPWKEREREFQLWRRGRYVEFNLMYDRGTLYGVQSGRRIESVLASLPPLVRWRYDWQAEPGTPAATLAERFLVPRDWADL